jgi:hypothetical protein
MAGCSRRALTVSAVAFVLLVSQLPLLGAPGPGFGVLRKRKIELPVRRPAVVRLANTSLAVKGDVSNPQYRVVLGSLQASLETELVKNERSLVKKPAGEANWTLELTVTSYSMPRSQSRMQPVNNAPPQTYERWTGSLNVAYQVVDQGGHVHDAGNVSEDYDQEFLVQPPQNGPQIPGLSKLFPTAAKSDQPHAPDDVQAILVARLVSRIAAQLGNTTEAVEAQVAGGDDHLDRAATFLDQGLWSRAVEELEGMPAYPAGEDESYRQYSLGLAYEAMSYHAPEFAAQRANLFEAQDHYDKAIELNPDQKYFVEVVARTRDSVARYRTLDAMQRDDKAAATTETNASGAGSAGAADALTVNDVIEMRAGGVPDAQIIELIQASAVAFALDKDTLLAVAKAKLPVTIQNEMRKKAGLPLVSAAGR